MSFRKKLPIKKSRAGDAVDGKARGGSAAQENLSDTRHLPFAVCLKSFL